MQIHELTMLASPDNNANVLAIDTGSRTYKITYANLAKAILEVYTGSNLYGTAQSVKTAFTQAQNALSAQNTALTNAINRRAEVFVSTSDTTGLGNIPLNSLGRIMLSDTESPLGTSALFDYVCFGNSSRTVLIVARPETRSAWINYSSNGTWGTWQSEVAASLATVTPTTFTPDNGTTWSTQGGCWYYKIGSRVHVHCAVQNITTDSNLQMISMPSGYIPYNVVVAGGRGSAATSPATIWINSSGVVSVRSTTAYAAGDLEYDAFS